MESDFSKNQYVRSVLDPTYGPVSIPDDITRLHTLRQETISVNLTVPESGQGLIVIYPNNPTKLVGAHYRYDTATSKFKFDKIIKTALNLGQYYNYARKSSQIIHIKSSTIPSGVYALSGTFNAARFESALSEVDTYKYEDVLAGTANSHDKKGNVKLGDGITILSLVESFNVPYMRLGDLSPSSSGLNVEVSSDRDDTTYSAHVGNLTGTLPTGPQESFELVDKTFNFDGVDGVIVQLTGDYVSSGPQQLQVGLNLIGKFGELVFGDVAYQDHNPGDPTYAMSLSAITLIVPEDKITQPVCALQLKISTKCDFESAVSWRIDGFTITATSRNSQAPGNCTPVVLVPYQGAAKDSIISVAGVANYELIPNPDLQKNMVLKYGMSNPMDITYLKYLMAFREKLGIRSVMSCPDYTRFSLNLRALYDYSMDPASIEAASFDWGQLLKWIRKIAVPGLSAAFPIAAPLIGAADQLVSDIVGDSASGTPIIASSAGPARGYSRRLAAYSADRPVDEVMDLLKPQSDKINPQPVLLDVGDAKTAFFAVVLMVQGRPSVEPVSARIYAAIELTEKIKSQYPHYSTLPSYKVGNTTVYNAKGPEPDQTPSVPHKSFLYKEYILLPIYRYSEGRIQTDMDPLLVTGLSHQLALVVAGPRTSVESGSPPGAVFTGSVSGSKVNPVFMLGLKKSCAQSLDLVLVGNGSGLVSVKSVGSLLALVPRLRPSPELTMPPPDYGFIAGSSVMSADQEGGFDPPLEGYSDPEPSATEVSQQVSGLFSREGMEPPSFQEKTRDVLDYLEGRDGLALQAIYGLLAMGRADSLTKTIVAMYNVAVMNPSSKRRTPEELARRVTAAGRVLTVDQARTIGKITPQVMKTLPLAAPSGGGQTSLKIGNSTRNIIANNAAAQRLMDQRGMGEAEVVQYFQGLGFVPTPQQLILYLSGGDPGTTPEQPSRAARPRQYVAYVGMLGANPDPGMVEQVRQMVDSVYDANGGRGPNEEQNKTLVRDIKSRILRSSVNPVPTDRLLPPMQLPGYLKPVPAPRTSKASPTPAPRAPSSTLSRLVSTMGNDDLA
nr:polyprotein [Cambodia Culex birnavirus]WOE89316.1 polyprotein [Cambodia Culex birnavirus]